MSAYESVRLQCRDCGVEHPLVQLRSSFRCHCGAPFELLKKKRGCVGEESVLFPRDAISARPWSSGMWRYREALPLQSEPVTLGEGVTPLVEFTLLSSATVGRLYAKLDYVNPSGSYKDRGVSLCISSARELGASGVFDDSSGNAGSSLATYAARARMPCRILCPSSTSPGKLVQVRASGAELCLIEGTRADVVQAALLASSESDYFYCSHNWSPMFIEGVKTISFEIVEQLGWSAPDHVVVPVGFGGVLIGVYEGFKELLGEGVIDKMPRIHSVQPEECATLYEAYARGEHLQEYNTGEAMRSFVCSSFRTGTKAEGIVAMELIRPRQMMEAVRNSHGTVHVVTNEQLREGLAELSHNGIYVEPTSAVVVQGYRECIEKGEISDGETTVCVLTGSGLKFGKEL